MVDVGRVDLDDVKPAKDSPVDMIRVASYVKDIDKAIHMVNHFEDKDLLLNSENLIFS